MIASLVQSLSNVGPRREDGGWARVATHSHMLRSHAVDFDQAKRNLVDWARVRGIAAVGVGSPWDPISARRYLQCETEDRDAYFGGRIPLETVMDREPIKALVRDLNRMGGSHTLFFLDNETPKNRHGHLWYVGFDYQVPAWHDYSQDRRVQFWDGDPREDPNALTGGCHRRRTYAEVVARQRQAGALAIWAHPTSWWTHQDAFITNIAAELVPHLHADGFLDGMVVQGYDAFHRAYQALWFDLLDRGAQVPGYAELDACFDQTPIAAAGTFLNYVPTPAPVPDLDTMIPTLRAARHYVSSGPHLVLEVDGQPMGSRLPGGAGARHRAIVTAWPAPGETCLSRIELIGRGGATLARVDGFTGGTLEFDVHGDDAGGWLLARAVGEHDDPDRQRQQQIRHCALTNPVFFDAPRSCRHDAVTVDLTVEPASDGAARGASWTLVTAAGDPLAQGVFDAFPLKLQTHPFFRLLVRYPDGRRRDIPLAMANAPLRAHIDHLADGHFRTDNPALEHGDVPVGAFRFDAVRAALATQTLLV
ncbi:MAG: hypothetical protein ACOX9C_07645 [Kiritimatiellia bacterium]|jgi:hypothetical protein